MVVGTSLERVDTFRGVPFAMPPVGPLRWRPPRRISWRGIRDASQFALPCAQPVLENGPNRGGVQGQTSEDCLYLNIWAPRGARRAPVIVWLHGGAGFLGAGSLGSYEGSSFAQHGVIVVTINYRLGMLGQFAHPALTQAAATTEPLANYSLMDAVAALEWVRRNGPALGADVNNVTLAGQSAGAVMVAALLAVPSARGLFQKAIVQSAVPLLGGRRTLAQAEADGVRFATILGLAGADATAEQLRSLSLEQVISQEARGPGFSNGSYLILDGRFRPITTGQGYERRRTVDIPLMVGSTQAEFFGPSVYELAQAANRYGRSPAWHYFFRYVPQWQRAEQPNGPPHAAELPYVFNSLRTSRLTASRAMESDAVVARAMHSCWIAFVRAPRNVRSLSCAEGFRWPARTMRGDEIAVFDARPSLERAGPIISRNAADFPIRPGIGEPE